MSQGLVSRGLVSPLGSCHADGLLAHDMVERFLLHYFGFGSAHAYTRGTVTTPEASSPDRDVGSTDYNPNANPHPHPHPHPRPRPNPSRNPHRRPIGPRPRPRTRIRSRSARPTTSRRAS